MGLQQPADGAAAGDAARLDLRDADPVARTRRSQVTPRARSARRSLPDPANGRGQYWVVTSGTLTRDGESLPKLSCVFVYPDDAPFEAAAGPDGTEVIVMQFPLHKTH